MNKTLLSAALIAGFGVAAIAPQAASAAGPVSSGTITITGTVTSSTCTVAVNGSPAGTIALNPVVNTVLNTVGSSYGWTPVTLTLTGCAAITGFTSVYPYFTGTNIDTTTGYLANTGASNVEIALSNSQGTSGALTLQNGSGAQNQGTQLLNATAPTFSYYAGYVAKTVPVTVGAVNTSVQYNLNYQ